MTTPDKIAKELRALAEYLIAGHKAPPGSGEFLKRAAQHIEQGGGERAAIINECIRIVKDELTFRETFSITLGEPYMSGYHAACEHLERSFRKIAPSATPTPEGYVLGQFRKRPVVIEAYCYNQKPENYRPDWFSDAVSANKIITHPDCCFIATLEGTMRCDLGDWVIRGVQGEMYSCKPEIFEATYEAAHLPLPRESD